MLATRAIMAAGDDFNTTSGGGGTTVPPTTPPPGGCGSATWYSSFDGTNYIWVLWVDSCSPGCTPVYPTDDPAVLGETSTLCA